MYLSFYDKITFEPNVENENNAASAFPTVDDPDNPYVIIEESSKNSDKESDKPSTTTTMSEITESGTVDETVDGISGGGGNYSSSIKSSREKETDTIYKSDKSIIQENNEEILCSPCCISRGVQSNQFTGSSTATSSSSQTTSSSNSSNNGQRRINPFVKLIKKLKNSKYMTITYYRNNLSVYVTIAIFFLIQILLIIIQLEVHSHVNSVTKMARAAGILLAFNSGLIVILVLRRLVTWLRNSVIGRFLPVDHFIKFHKFIGIFILICSIIHTIGHMINLCKKLFFFRILKLI